MADQLRRLPSVDEILQHESVAGLCALHNRTIVTSWVRSAIDDQRQRLIGGESFDDEALFAQIVRAIASSAEVEVGQSVRPVINATGIILHTNLGRSPLADQAIARMQATAGYASVELNLASGRRSKRGERVNRLLAQLAGADDALVVNNCAAATMLVLQALSSGKQTIVSRGQLVEIGGGFRLPDVFRAAGVLLREVGTTNRTYLNDYEAAINDETAVIIRVHRSNFYQGGFVTEPGIAELVGIARPDYVPVVDDLGSGCVGDLSRFGIDEPTVQQSVGAGADLTLFSGDKLFGGPQAGIIVGRARWIDHLRTSPMMRAMRVDKLTLAALEATAEIHLRGEGLREIPILRMISEAVDTIEQRARTVAHQMINQDCVTVVPSQARIGGGSSPGTNLTSYAVELRTDRVDELARRLRKGKPAVQGRISDERLLLDMRTVSETEVPMLVNRINDELDPTSQPG